ncbi:hypothetical protein DET57_107187 [Klebsiella oxytoca]|uniref:Uncharacterized protein n=1 Tax=Klebsiella oxytoca TaxID=571 RepID=A0A318FP18_KLEOX|nr:hypothetical protein DET57_107187 [Klebsiella oxytoca]
MTGIRDKTTRMRKHTDKMHQQPLIDQRIELVLHAATAVIKIDRTV